MDYYSEILGYNLLEDCYIYIAKYCFKVVNILIHMSVISSYVMGFENWLTEI